MIAFSHPWALVLALPAAWLLWRSRRRDTATHVVANLFLWVGSERAERQTPSERRAAPPWLAWLQAFVLLSLAVGVAAPVLPNANPVAVLIIDVSTSMSARDGSASRLSLAAAAAKQWLAGRRGERVLLIAAGRAPHNVGVVDAGSLRASDAIDALAIANEPADLAAAIASARRQTAGDVVIVTDGMAPDDIGAMGVTWLKVGAPADNVGLTQFAATADGGAILEVSNFGASTRRVTVDVTGGQADRRESFDVPAGGARGFAIAPGASSASRLKRTLIASLSVDGGAGNAVAADDRRTLDVEPQLPVVLQYIGGDAMIAAALNALPDVRVVDARNAARNADAWICTGACSSPADVPVLIFVAGGTVPAIARRDENGRRQIDVAVDLRASPWPLTPAFPIFMADSIDWLTRRPEATLTTDRVAEIAESDARSTVAPHVDEVPSSSAAPARREAGRAVMVIGLIGVAAELAARRRHAAVRTAALLMITGAVAGVALPWIAAGRTVAVTLDASASVAGNQRAIGARVREETAHAGPRDSTSTVRFGGTSSHIASGLRAARAGLALSGDRRILLISDGEQTEGDAVAEAALAGAAGVPIDVVPVDSRTPAFIERMEAPVSVRAGAPVTVRVELRGRPNEIVALAIARDGRELDHRRVALNDLGHASVTISDAPAGTGVSFYRATLSDERLGLVLSERGAAVTVTGRSRVLVIANARSTFAPFISTGPFDVVEITSAAVPDTRERLAEFSALVLDAVAPHLMTTRQLDAIATAVSIDGAGLLVLGSKDSLEAADYAPSALSDALPVDLTTLPRPPAASTALALLVDVSGSMASSADGVTKIAAARDAISRALALVPSGDPVMVIGFAAQPVVVIGPGDARDAAAVADKLKTLSPSGSTALAPAARDAVSWLRGTATTRRRLLLVTDGKTSVSDADATRAAVAGQSIEVSVVTIGNDAEREWLSELAASTGGRAFFPERLGDLAREVAREASRGAAGRDVSERFTVRSGAHPLAPGARPPTLDGYVAARLREGATAAWKSQTGDAVLAAWPRGLGRAVVFTSDWDGAWASPMRAWPQNRAFWVGAINWMARSADDTGIDATLTVEHGGPRVVVELGASSRSAGFLQSVTATIAAPSGETRDVVLHAVSPARFEAPLRLAEAGDYRATIVVTDDASETRASRGWHWTGDLESQSRGVNLALLAEVARVSGGRVLPPLGATVRDSEAVFNAPRRRGRIDVAAWLLVGALALLSFDYLRRAAEA